MKRKMGNGYVADVSARALFHMGFEPCIYESIIKGLLFSLKIPVLDTVTHDLVWMQSSSKS